MAHTRRLFLAFFLAAPLAPARAQSAEPAVIVRQMFESYKADKEPHVPWSPAVAARMKRTRIEADPILHAQDVDVKEFTLREISRGADRAVVEVRFLSFGRRMVSQFDFRLVDGRWVIGNYRNLSGAEQSPSDVRKWLGMPPLT